MGVELNHNDLRHSGAYFYSLPIADFRRGQHKEALARQMLHSIETAQFKYLRMQIYDLSINRDQKK